MTYDPEKYRAKREKVLGIKKRGLSFGAIASIVSAVIIMGLSLVTIPQAISYMTTRNLDDAIYKLDAGKTWSDAVIADIATIEGVKAAIKDKHDTRLVITFDRRTVQLARFKAIFSKNNLDTTLLNQVNHRQRQATLKEEEELETP